jgi:HAD superfamily hydrolase (TIGR01509 family)
MGRLLLVRPQSMNPKCIIFDLDGTLVDSEALSSRALLDLIPGINEDIDTLTDLYHGKRFANILVDLEKRFQCSIPEDFEPNYREYVSILFENELQPIPGVFEMLSTICNPRCIASSGPLPKIKHSLKITGLAGFFGTNLFSAYEIGSWKPEPDLFLYASRQMRFTPDDCVVVEDSPTGIEAAKAAGMNVLHFTSEPIEPNKETYTAFSEMTQLPKLLSRIEDVA